MHKKFEVNQTKIKGRFQLETKAAELISNSELSLECQISKQLKIAAIKKAASSI